MKFESLVHFINVDEVRKTINYLQEPGSVFEIRIITTAGKKEIYSGYFKDADAMLKALQSIDQRRDYPYNRFTLEKRNIYISLNTLKEDCFSRSQSECFEFNPSTTSDQDVTEYRWLFIDLDPVRTSGVSSSDSELQAAKELAKRVYSYLRELDFKDPVKALSGNGCHLLYRISVPNDKAGTGKKLIENCLKALDLLFSNESVDLDTTNFNPSRVCKLHGTLAQKGKNTEERPHRMSYIFSEDPEPEVTPIEILQKLAANSPDEEQCDIRNLTLEDNHSRSGSGAFDLEEFLLRNGLTYTKGKTDRAAKYMLDECPFNSSHRQGDARIFQYSNGAIAFKCHHNSCSGKKWQDVRLKFEPDAYSYKERQQEKSMRSGSGADSAGKEFAFDTIDPFGLKNTNSLPEFKAEWLPEPFKGYAESVAESLQVSIDMVGVALLTVVSCAVQKRFCIHPKAGWVEPLNLYSMIIAEPSERKSPVQREVTRPIHIYTKRENEERAEEIADSEAQYSILVKRKQGLLKKIESGKAADKIDSIRQELAGVIKELNEFKLFTGIKILADDVTPEEVLTLMQQNNESISVFSSEGGLFDVLAGLYTDGKSHYDVFLKSYSGDYIQVDRRSGQHVTFQNPAITMLLFLQPAVISKVMENEDFKGRGMISRLLFCFPHSLIGRRRYHTEPIDPFCRDPYTDRIIELLKLPVMDEVRMIQFSNAADKLAEQYFNETESGLEKGDFDDMQDYGGKVHGNAMRLAGIIHVMKHGIDAAKIHMEPETVSTAIEISRYFKVHSQHAYFELGIEPEPVKDAKTMLKKLKSSIKSQKRLKRQKAAEPGQSGTYDTKDTSDAKNMKIEFSRREFIRLDGHRYENKPERATAMLKALEERNYVHCETVKTPGRPKELIEVNPEYVKQCINEREEI